MKNNIAVLPLGAFEQHGPHLPLDTDSIIAKNIVSRLKKDLNSQEQIKYIDCEEIGYSIEHMFDARTRSLSYEEAIKRWIEIGKHCYEGGIHKLILLNAHGGNSPLMAIVCMELRARFNILCVQTSWSRFGLPAHLLSDAEKGLDIHGGFIETSLMLAIAPEKVDMTKAQNFSNKQQYFIENFHYLRAYGPHSFGWMMNDLNQLGVCGRAGDASAKAGQEILDHILSALALLVADVVKFDLNLLIKPQNRDHKPSGL